MSEAPIILHSSGALPGIPGEHAPGNYLVDYEARTIRPVSTETINEDSSGPTEPLPDPSADSANGDEHITSTESPAPTPDVATEIAHIEAELNTLTAEQQQQR